jgi:hypothetical protein
MQGDNLEFIEWVSFQSYTPEDAPVFVPENPDAMADDSWKRMLWSV